MIEVSRLLPTPQLMRAPPPLQAVPDILICWFSLPNPFGEDYTPHFILLQLKYFGWGQKRKTLFDSV